MERYGRYSRFRNGAIAQDVQYLMLPTCTREWDSPYLEAYTNMSIETEKWIEIEMSKCPQSIIDKIGGNTVEAFIKQDVETNISYCNDDEFGKRIFDLCKVEGTKPTDYKYKHLQTRFGEMITSIRFIGGDMNKPAVFLMHKDFELDSIDDIEEIGQLIAREYAIFKPQRIRWYSSKIEKELIDAHDSLAGDLVYVAEFIEELKKKPFPQRYEAVNLVEAKGLDWYEDYVKTFERIYEKWPLFVEMAQVESKEILNDLIEKKLLFEIQINGKFAGIIAADKGMDLFMEGYYIVEEVLMENFRGKHYAPAVQRHLIERLSSENNEMLYGTIHYDNVPSLKTAFGVGREVVGMYVFATIPAVLNLKI